MATAALTNRNTHTSLPGKDAIVVSIRNYDFIIDNFQYTTEDRQFECLPEKELTKMSMHISEKSLIEGWENESDSHWEKFLKEEND